MDKKPSKRPRLTAPSVSALNGDIVDLTETDRTSFPPKNQEPLFLDASGAVIKLFTLPEDTRLKQDFAPRQISISPNSHLNHVMNLREILGLDPLWKPHKASHNPTMMAQGYPERKSIEWFILCNYMCDFDFLLRDCPELICVPNKVFFIHDGYSNPDPWRLLDPSADVCPLNPSDEPTKSTNPLKYKFPSGTHHTKMLLVGMEDRLRVIVYTANMLQEDFQVHGAFVQDFPFKDSVASAPTSVGDDFEKTLKHYLESYDYQAKKQWSLGGPARTLVEQIAQYDFSNAKGILIPSIPGYHATIPEDRQRPQNGRSKKPLHGYLKLKHAVQTYAATESSSSTRYGPVVCQFSSIGSLSEKWMRDFSTSLSAAPPKKGKPDLVDLVKVVWPSMAEMEGSNAGIAGALASLPGRKKNFKRFLIPLLCKWSPRHHENNPIHRPRSIPHIKTFFQLQHTKKRGKDSSSKPPVQKKVKVTPHKIEPLGGDSDSDDSLLALMGRRSSPAKKVEQEATSESGADNGNEQDDEEEEKSLAWFCIGSQNLSKAAWGDVIHGKYGKSHKVNAWEMGVFVCPRISGKRLVPFTGKECPEDMAIPLPYDCIPQRYSSNDVPFNVDDAMRMAGSMGGGMF